MFTPTEDHTRRAYNGLAEAYSYFNQCLFDGKLPSCLITVQRKKNCNGYYSPNRFSPHSAQGGVDEIALNPANFENRTPEQILSTFVHEMVHLWQQHFGDAPRRAYHNKEWANHMKHVGLHPSNTGLAGGKETGARVTHYIIPQGKFAIACATFLASAEFVLYSDKQTPQGAALAKKKADSKTKYTCEMCGQNAWAKPQAWIKCGTCDETMLVEDEQALKAA